MLLLCGWDGSISSPVFGPSRARVMFKWRAGNRTIGQSHNPNFEWDLAHASPPFRTSYKNRHGNVQKLVCSVVVRYYQRCTLVSRGVLFLDIITRQATFDGEYHGAQKHSFFVSISSEFRQSIVVENSVLIVCPRALAPLSYVNLTQLPPSKWAT